MILSNNTEQNNQTSEIKDIAIFKDKRFCLFVYKKTGRLSAGVYVVTNLLSDSEPLKWELRKCTQKLVTSSTDERLFHTSSLHTVVTTLHTHSLAILSLLEVAFYAGLITEMNYSILRQEFMIFISSIEEKLDGFYGTVDVLDSRFFELGKEYRLSRNDFDRENKSRSNERLQYASKGQHIGQKKDKDFNITSNQNSDPKALSISKGQTNTAEQKKYLKNSRKESILNLLKNKESLTIRDFSNNIKDCSEKTIQRELLSLVTLGVLKKEGERRWSRYAVATNIIE